MKYKVTILIAIYKAASFMESKIKSLLAQTIFNDCQIVLLNCQNLENEADLYADFLKQHQNVMEIKYANYVSLYQSWTDGIKATDSDFVVNYNMDDQWHPEYLQKCTAFLEENQEFSIISSRVLMTYHPNQLWPAWESHDEFPYHPYPLSTAGPCPVWRRSLHNKYGYFDDYYVIGDAKLWEKWLAGKEIFGLLNERLVLYYASDQSLERRCDPTTGESLRELDLKRLHDEPQAHNNIQATNHPKEDS